MKNPQTPPQGQAGDGAAQAPATTAPGPGQADLGDPKTAQASTPAAPAPGAPSSAQAAAAAPEQARVVRGEGKRPTVTQPTRVKNRTEHPAFFAGQRIRPGQTLTLQPGEQLARWMEPVDGKVRDDLAALLEGSPKKRGSAGVVLKNPTRQRSGGGALKPLETGTNTDDGI